MRKFFRISSFGIYNAIIMPKKFDREKKLMNRFLILFISLCLYSISINANAAWYETEGTAPIKNGDISQARSKAIDEALRQAMLQSGSFVTSEQEITNGKISKDFFNLSSASNVNQYSLISETRNNGFLTVKIRTFIDNQMQMCLGDSYTKTIMPILFIYDNNQYQNSNFGLVNFNIELTKSLSNLLGNSRKFNNLPYYNKNLGIDPIKYSPGKDHLSEILLELAIKNDTQYIVLGVIRDISLSNAQGMLNSLLDNKNRELKISIYVYDGLLGSLVFSNDYEGSSEWDDGIQMPQGAKFNESNYGRLVNNTLGTISRDIIQVLTCQKPIGRIIETLPNDEYYINLGSLNGIKQGTRFFIDHRSNFYDNNGNLRFSKARAHSQMIAIKVDSNSSIIKPVGKISGNIQLEDLVFIE